MAGILIFLFCVFALHSNRAGATEVTTTIPRPVTVTEGQAWETRNFDGWMISVMPYALVSFRSVTLSNITGITLCMRAVTEKKWLIEDSLQLTFGENTGVYFKESHYVNYNQYQLQVGYSSVTFDRFYMVPIKGVHSLWKSRCLTWDSSSGMTQLWFDGMMSVRKGLSRGRVFSGQAELTMSNFEGQLSDVYLWDSVLSVQQLHRYLYQNSAPSQGRVLDWTQMTFRARDYVVIEPAYPQWLSIGPVKHRKQKWMKSLKKRMSADLVLW